MPTQLAQAANAMESALWGGMREYGYSIGYIRAAEATQGIHGLVKCPGGLGWSGGTTMRTVSAPSPAIHFHCIYPGSGKVMADKVMADDAGFRPDNDTPVSGARLRQAVISTGFRAVVARHLVRTSPLLIRVGRDSYRLCTFAHCEHVSTIRSSF
jgi:hypothetical protein